MQSFFLCAQEVMLSDHEAACIIPCLVEKSGHNQASKPSACASLAICRNAYGSARLH